MSVPLAPAIDRYVARRDVESARGQLTARGDCPRTLALVDVVLSGRALDRPPGCPAAAAPASAAHGHLTAAEVRAVAHEMNATQARYRSAPIGVDGADHALRALHDAVRRAAEDGVGLSTFCG